MAIGWGVGAQRSARVRVTVVSARAMMVRVRAILRLGQESKVRVQESKVRTIPRAIVQGKGKSEGQGQDQG
jgi:hypothetical protein